MSRLTYEELGDRIDAALHEIFAMQAAHPTTQRAEYFACLARGEWHPNDVAYEAARAAIMARHLDGTGWTEAEWEAENLARVCRLAPPETEVGA